MKQSMILLHGLFGGLSNWSSVVRHFKNRFNIIIPQLPLHEKHTGNMIEHLVAFLEAMIINAQLEQVILVGNSLGGHIATRYTHRNPDKAARLILTGSSGLYENTQLGSFPKRSNYNYIRERVAATFYNPAMATEELIAEVMQVTTDPSRCLSTLRTAKATKLDNVLTCLPEIPVPTLLIWGKDDQITPPEVACQFRDHLPNAQLIMLTECGHVPMMEQPEAFNSALETFLCRP